ncbi:MAG: CHAT domain-containing protein, partial [Gemmatimonadaceae bacterium]
GSSSKIFASVANEAQARGFVGVAARALSALATNQAREGGAERALDLLRESERLHASIGEQQNVGLSQSIEAVVYATLGDRANSYEAGLRAVASLQVARSSVRLHNALYLLAEHALSDSLPLAALAIQREDIRIAEGTGGALNIAEAHVAAARILRALGDSTAENGELQRAREALQQAHTGVGKEWVDADLMLAEAERGAPNDETYERLRTDSAITFFQHVGLTLRYLPALALRARHSARSGNTRAAQRDLETILRTVEREVALTADRQVRATLLASAREASEELMLLKLQGNDPVGALRAVERGRSGGSAEHFLPIAREQGVTIVDFAVVRDTLFAWVIAGDSVSMTRTPLSAKEWKRRVERVRSLLELHVTRESIERDLIALYDLVVRPIERLFPASTNAITIVADGEVAEAPIAAFIDSTSRRYVVQRWALRYAATLHEAVLLQKEPPRPAGEVLLVSDPAFDGSGLPSLTRLRGARAEVRAIAPLYAASVLLEDSAATFAAISRAVGRAAVMHVAAHVRFDPQSPEHSTLPLAGGDVLTPTRIAQLSLGAMRLVVLSACEAAREGGGRAGALTGLASAFRARGVRTVVGGLWRIRDDEATLLMTAFHRNYAKSSNGAFAMRSAQLGLIEASDERLRSPSVWAGFRVVGW